MILDNSNNPHSIRNVSYLMPIGICLFIIIENCHSIVSVGLLELGLQFEMEPYLNFWLVQLGSSLLIYSGGYFFVKRLWRKIGTGEFNCARLFISFLIISIAIVFISYLIHDIVRIYEDFRMGRVDDSYVDYMNFNYQMARYIWLGNLLILILVITFALRIPTNNSPYEHN